MSALGHPTTSAVVNGQVRQTWRGRQGKDGGQWRKKSSSGIGGGSRKRSHFQKQEQELIAKLQQRSREEAARRGMAERTGVVDHEILQELEKLGYTPETVMLFHLVPLLQVAWAERDVSDRERALIIEAARACGIQTDSAADRQLATWLLVRPSSDFFEKTLRLIGAVLQARPLEEREDSQRDLVSYCTAIASASGGILGFGRVSPEEQRVLARISQGIERARGPLAGPARPPGEARS